MAKAPSQRQLRVGEEIRRTLSDALMRGDVHDPALAGLSITVTEVEVTADLRIATVFVMPLGGGDREAAISGLKRAKGELRHHVARSMALKHAPDLRFRIDGTFDRMDDTRRMLSDPRVRRDVEARDEDADGDPADEA
ncbi:ribosome-binding factor A [Wenxinia saemankumensis]|uniref:Ribosome-binding factor A n=2 Tax=Wenxinia saemankumensis TaxID=1447782 RepID=A0A1M6EB69_9RHOB|nr:30S ribosome-binding factor RbfA [Wenxinia saemankumensis]SHI82767.1 ribosome-binding factor A [Wenxinia saemankumensis]